METASTTLYFINREELTSVLRYIRPRNMNMYYNVFMHKSILKHARKEFPEAVSNERLEFLGDSVLNMIIGEYLYERYPDKNEGFLTKLRIKLVNGKTLAYLARKLRLDRYVNLANNTKINNKILEDALEALIGAIYLDYREINMGLNYVRQFLVSLFQDEINFEQLMFDNNFKDILLRYMQQRHLETPIYEVVNVSGKSHNPIFSMSVTVVIDNNTYTAQCSSMTKRDTEQLCAHDILNQIGFNEYLI
ncbi:putative ribonuclease III [Heterosigma akashiwo virus 01]|jgi:ribonuclease III|uniref:ribonuclease III n=1 Tax=Heterosigma akashiwo virus 01 TaxID=97195 RepID=A0A1C9C5A7_HAV01|nr:putative ribonuclease III [Heterosigma akashiwo virus 01]AOM63468.1 putative ribonuclease III [Heterosigma akashiwo virus 01]